MDTLLNDVRFAIRTWARSPGFFTTAVLTLALAIGANTTMFSLIDAALLRPLPFPEAERIVTVWRGRIDNPESLSIVSMPNFRDYAARSRSFESLAIFDSAGRGYNLTGDGEGEQVSGVRVTASFFDVLGVRPLRGRTFLPEEEEPGRDRVVVLSHGLWTRRYAGDPAIIGRTIQIDGLAHTVIGVMPLEFQFQFWSGPRQLWVPAGWTRGDHNRDSNSFVSIGRLKPGVSLDAARSEMDTIGRALAADYPVQNVGSTVRLVPIAEYGVAGVARPLAMLLGVVGFVLLIACANVANLLLARAATRHREIAIRSALGAGRSRIVRQLLTESVLLAIVGGTAGVLLAIWIATAAVPWLPNSVTRLPMRSAMRIELNASILLFTVAVSLISGLIFGLAPALAVFRQDVNHPLKEGARGTIGGKSRVKYGLVAAEMALTLVVLAGAGVMIVSLTRLLDVDPGLDPRNVLVMHLSLPQEDLYNGPPGHLRFCDDLDRQVGSVGGVRSTSAIAHLPLAGGGAGRGFTVEGRPDPGVRETPGAGYTVACPGILATLGIDLLSGREFTHRDTDGAPGVALINESMAKRYWPNEDAVGKRFKLGRFDNDTPWITVIGVFRDVRHWGLDTDASPSFIRPYSQAGWPMMSVVAKTAGPPGTTAAAVKRALAIIEPEQPVTNILTMEEIVARSLSGRRFPMYLMSGFALLALVLAAVGIAGVVGYSVVQRTQEIGVRMALGANPRDVLRLVLGHSLGWTLAGIGVGLVASVALLRLLESLVFDIEPADPLVLVCVSALLVAVALAASYVPARRAATVDPVTALRSE